MNSGKTRIFEKKGRNFASGVRFSESATSVFSPMGYRSKELSKKDGFSMKKVFYRKKIGPWSCPYFYGGGTPLKSKDLERGRGGLRFFEK